MQNRIAHLINLNGDVAHHIAALNKAGENVCGKLIDSQDEVDDLRQQVERLKAVIASQVKTIASLWQIVDHDGKV